MVFLGMKKKFKKLHVSPNLTLKITVLNFHKNQSNESQVGSLFSATAAAVT